jgi:hypothetical protein
MSESITIKGFERVRSILGTKFEPVLRTALKAIAIEVENTIKPYGATGVWNSPANPKGRWYERGYGPRWWVSGEVGLSAGYSGKSATGRRREVLALSKRGAIHGRATSEMLNRSWHVEQTGPVRFVISSNASYAGQLHRFGEQARWAKSRGWLTDRDAVRAIVRSGRAEKIVTAAIVAALR